MVEDNTSLYEKREKIQAQDVKGFFNSLRNFTIYITLGAYFLGPWLFWNGRQAILFDLPNRKFYILGITFWPQDFFLLSWLLILAAMSLFVFTVLSGRLWCGYTCPQTVWVRLFLGLERICEGKRNARIKLDKQSWSVNKAVRRTAKHTSWLILSFITAFTFVGYFTPVKTLFIETIQLNLGPWQIVWITFFTCATYINAGWMREQICLYLCPYARFQSVMFDQDTLIIAYDEKRGEPRGSRSKSEDYKALGKGDCINCNQCVHVCPTGIDIRDGLQMACINCTACIDACNSIMDKMAYPRGLIRYDTSNRLENKSSHILRPRLMGYASILLIMASVFLYALFNRIPFDIDVIRDRKQLYRETSTGLIENVYTLKLFNMSQEIKTYTITLTDSKSFTYKGQSSVTIQPGDIATLTVQVQAKPDVLTGQSMSIYFKISDQTEPSLSKTELSKFIGPLEKS